MTTDDPTPPIKRQVQVRVSFSPESIKGPSEKTGRQAPAALRFCNKAMDAFPESFRTNQMEGALDSAATGAFVDDSHKGLNHQDVLAEDRGRG